MPRRRRATERSPHRLCLGRPSSAASRKLRSCKVPSLPTRATRLAAVKAPAALVARPDALGTESAPLYNDVGRHGGALPYIESRRFHPGEGGEGLVAGEYVRAHLRLGQAALAAKNPAEALRH